jgi:hypothetical protein
MINRDAYPVKPVSSQSLDQSLTGKTQADARLAGCGKTILSPRNEQAEQSGIADEAPRRMLKKAVQQGRGKAGDCRHSGWRLSP